MEAQHAASGLVAAAGAGAAGDPRRCRDILTGVSINEVTRRWNNAEGLRTAAGREWVHVSVREALKRPTLGGAIEHDGKPVGKLDGEPILDQRTFERLRALFAGRKRGRVVGERYVGTGTGGRTAQRTPTTRHSNSPLSKRPETDLRSCTQRLRNVRDQRPRDRQVPTGTPLTRRLVAT